VILALILNLSLLNRIGILCNEIWSIGALNPAMEQGELNLDAQKLAIPSLLDGDILVADGLNLTLPIPYPQ